MSEKRKPRLHIELVRSTEPIDFDAWAEQYIRLALELRREKEEPLRDAA